MLKENCNGFAKFNLFWPQKTTTVRDNILMSEHSIPDCCTDIRGSETGGVRPEWALKLWWRYSTAGDFSKRGRTRTAHLPLNENQDTCHLNKQGLKAKIYCARSRSKLFGIFQFFLLKNKSKNYFQLLFLELCSQSLKIELHCLLF